ncbi:MAG: TatD family hydrolase [Chloroflexi bacterium]|nr:TatD family hydrolase [Chloroflexota bacterium]
MESISNQLIDTHCHIDFEDFNIDREKILDNARNVGVTHIINPGIDLNSSEQIINLSQKIGLLYPAVGIHPNSKPEYVEKVWFSRLKELAKQPKVIAIGEIGLDYYRKSNSIDYQKYILKLQLALAVEMNLPVIIHNRQAGNDLIEVLSDWTNRLKYENSLLQSSPGVLHSFSDDELIAKRAIDLGFYIGVTGPITFNNTKELKSIISKISLEHLLLETDAPFLTPHPFRGKRNEPANVIYIARKIAEIQNLPLERVIKQTTLNAKSVFRLRDRN